MPHALKRLIPPLKASKVELSPPRSYVGKKEFWLGVEGSTHRSKRAF